MMNCIFCTTPFQIMTALHLCTQVDDQFDIYLMDQFKNAEDVADSLRELHIFHDVILVHENEIIDRTNQLKLALRFQIVWSYITMNRTAKKILKDKSDIQYDQMYISSKAFTSRIVSFYYVKNDFQTKIIYFDDGLGSYFNKSTFYPGRAGFILRKLILGKRAQLIYPKTILLYEPNLFYKAGVNTGENITVEPISKWTRDIEFTRTLNKVFNFSAEDIIKESIIIFDGLYQQDEKERLESFYEEIISLAGRDNVIIKKHPRDSSSGVSGLKYYGRSELPIELICQNTDMKKKLLIAVATTAVVTPILLYGEEPYILILNDIPDVTNNHPNAQYQFFKDMYTQKDRFYEAKSKDAALAFLNYFISKNM